MNVPTSRLKTQPAWDGVAQRARTELKALQFTISIRGLAKVGSPHPSLLLTVTPSSQAPRSVFFTVLCS
jgi:hypothetical protein